MMSSLPLWTVLGIFAAASALIWWAGTRLERLADALSTRTGMGQAFTGMLLLAAATSLPEIATTVTAVAILDNPTLAVHNLLGGVAMQTAILVVADATKGRKGALTFFSPQFVLLIEGIGLLLLLSLTIGGITAKGTPTFSAVSGWIVALLVAYSAVMYLVYRYRGQPRWTPSSLDDLPAELRPDYEPEQLESDERPLVGLWVKFGGFSMLVMAGGWAATQSAELLADQTGLGDAFLGATLLAIATSLPELSTTCSATRNGRYTAAISNVFGSNAFDVTLLVLAEMLYRKSSVLAHAEPSVVFVAAIGAVMTCVYLWGLIERENRSVLGIGWDSALVGLTYLAGMAVLYVIT
jgi:cation:H+ antiporter